MENFNDSKLNEECGVFGVHKVDNAARLTYYGLHSLQHRGQEANGIASSDGNSIKCKKQKGLIAESFKKKDLLALSGNNAIGHVRYSNVAENIQENIQPLMVRAHQGEFAVVNNGQIVNALELRTELETAGAIFQGTTDTEIICHLIQRGEGTFLDKVTAAVARLEGAFSLIIMTKNTMYAARDKYGLKPLSIAKLEDGYAISSETCAFEIVNATFMADIKPGEIVKLGKNGYESHQMLDLFPKRMCAMEYIYFARPDSDIDGLNVHSTRRKSGQLLAKKDYVEADIVVGVPDSSLSAAMGYSDASGLPYELGLIKNKYIGRTFIQPTQEERSKGVKMKLSAVKSIVSGKRIVLIDDSIVRGTTSERIVSLLKEAGAKEVHVRIASSPLISPCFYGVDMKSTDELISVSMNTEELSKYIKADSLDFLTIDEMKQAFGDGICTGCFEGKYVTDLYSYAECLENPSLHKCKLR